MRGTVKSFTLEQKIKILKFLDQPGMSIVWELFEEMVDQDADAPIVGELTDVEIIQATQQSKSPELEEDEEDEEEVEVPLSDVLESLTKVRTFSQKSGLSSQVLCSLRIVETMITKEKNNRTTQASITNYFKN